MYLYPTLLHIQKFVTVLYYIVDYNTLAVKRKTTSRHFTPIILKLTPLFNHCLTCTCKTSINGNSCTYWCTRIWLYNVNCQYYIQTLYHSTYLFQPSEEHRSQEANTGLQLVRKTLICTEVPVKYQTKFVEWSINKTVYYKADTNIS